MTKSERFGIIERLLLVRGNVRFRDMQERLGVSRATLHRDLRDLRDRMNVPIICDRDTGFYRIDRAVPRYELPGLWFSAAEIHALLGMQQLLNDLAPGGLLSEQIAPLRQRLIGLLESRTDSVDDIARRIRIIGATARAYAPQHFQSVAAALMERHRLHIRYRARSSGQISEREISPQRLTHYRDNWYLDAWCHLRDELRSFAVDAILAAKASRQPAREIADSELDASLAAGYGIFSGRTVRWVTLLFTPERARWVAAEHWHREQEGHFLDDGRYQLRVPYSDDPELLMDILKYGPDCEVAEPETLRRKVAQLLRKALRRYGSE